MIGYGSGALLANQNGGMGCREEYRAYEEAWRHKLDQDHSITEG